MNNIFLLSPWCEREYFSPQNSLLYLKYCMADHGYPSKIIDCSHYDAEYDHVAALIKESEKPIIGVTAYTRERYHAYRLVRRLKKDIPDSLIVVGGRHFGNLSEETLFYLPEVDIVVRGEGEVTMKEICDVVYKNKKIEDVLGVSFRINGEIKHNSDRPPESNLDKFRSFDINDEEMAGLHKMTANSKVDAEGKYFGVVATRGCPNRCVYCSITATKARYRSIDSIIKEIEEKIQLTGVRNVIFGDASLTINRHFIEKLCP